MKYEGDKATGVKIAYIGGGSRGWAWGLMSDLATAEHMSGDVYLYDIEYQAAVNNEIIGNKYNDLEGTISKWNYHATKTIDEALKGADFVVISILPGTLKEMRSDVHTPEKYGIFQPVGDTTGPGGIIRALRTIPMFEEIGLAIKENCPDAWVINYTNPMAVAVNTLSKVFPKIKVFGCCHEVFGTQRFLAHILKKETGIDAKREEMIVNVIGVNHFTWLTSAKYKGYDLFPLYEKFCNEWAEKGCFENASPNWVNVPGSTGHKVKMDLFRRYGVIAAAGDRHLAEFCEGSWYLKDAKMPNDKWLFTLTTVDYRDKEEIDRRAKSERLVSGEEACKITQTGEEGVIQMTALLGFHDMFTNVNIPNTGQIPNLPLGTVVETNASFRTDSLVPAFAGNIPENILALILRNAAAQAMVVEAGLTRNLDLAFEAFVHDPLVTIQLSEAKELFDEMIHNTKDYLKMYF